MPVAQCPCGARYKVREDMAGRKARCKKCGRVFQIPRRGEAPILVADEPDWPGAAEVEAGPPPADTASASMFDESVASTTSDADEMPRTDHLPRLRPRTGFWSDVGWTLLFFISPHSMVMFMVVWVLAIGAQFIGCFGFVVKLMIFAWYMNIIAETASGDDDLPKFSVSGSIVEDLILPGLQYVLTGVILFAPAFLYAVYFGGTVFMDALQSPTGTDPYALISSAESAAVPLVVLVALAVFLWPAALMCVSMGGLTALMRIDLIAVAVARSFLPYLMIVLLIGAATILPGVILAAATATAGGTPGTSGLTTGFKAVIAFVTVARGVETYFMVIVMRLIGLYYRHFKQRFPWDWE